MKTLVLYEKEYMDIELLELIEQVIILSRKQYIGVMQLNAIGHNIKPRLEVVGNGLNYKEVMTCHQR